tara:strand:- start:8100 stop:8363 length:264 start_codon:yes stop_codon:yes gene_type:complete
MAKLERGQKIYYKDWTDNNKIYPAKVIHCKYRYVIIDVLLNELSNVWKRWEVNIEDCEPTDDFNIIRPLGAWLGEMIEFKEGVKANE